MSRANPLKTLRRLIRKLPSVEVSESNGVRYLHLGGDAIQSSIRLSDPERLELHYTRAMMAFLLFAPAPRDVLMVGVGGGSIARFLHHHFAQTRITGVEVNPQVVSAARMYFGLPDDDERIAIHVADAAEFVPAHPASADVLLHDAFDDGDAVEALCTQDFFDCCANALRADGIFVMNFMMDEPRFDVYRGRLARSFDDRLLLLPTGDRVNRIVFAFKGAVGRLPIERLQKDAAAIESALGLPMLASCRDLVRFNPHTAAYLEVRPRPARDR